MKLFFLSLQPLEVMRQSAVLVHVSYPEHSNFDLLGSTDSGRLRVLVNSWCDELQSWFLHLGLVKLNGAEHIQTNAFVLGDKAACSLQTCAHTHRAIASPSLLLVTLYVKV